MLDLTSTTIKSPPLLIRQHIHFTHKHAAARKTCSGDGKNTVDFLKSGEERMNVSYSSYISD